MIGRRESPDGMPFRLYVRVGKRKTSYGYKAADGTWAFRLTAPSVDKAACAAIRRQAIDRANALNGNPGTTKGTFEDLATRYFQWQKGMLATDERRKAETTLTENAREAKKLIAVFGRTAATGIKTQHIYTYLDKRATAGAPAKANKEIALLSAILEYGRRLGEITDNPVRDISYNPVRPKTTYNTQAQRDFVMAEARRRKGSYLVLALTMMAAYSMVCRPGEIRALHRQQLGPDGVTIPIGKRKAGEAQRSKLIRWSPTLKATIDEALSLQVVPGMYVFGNQKGQLYTKSGWGKIWWRLMNYCEVRAKEEGREFVRFSLMDMRPAAVTDRKEAGDQHVQDATGHADNRMVEQVYDRRRVRKADSTD